MNASRSIDKRDLSSPSVASHEAPQESESSVEASREVAPPEKPYFIVWNASRSEGFITEDQDDADVAASGYQHAAVWSTLAGHFHDVYEYEPLKIEAVSLPLSGLPERELSFPDEGVSPKEGTPLPQSTDVQRMIERLNELHLYGDLSWVQAQELAKGAASLLTSLLSDLSRATRERDDFALLTKTYSHHLEASESKLEAALLKQGGASNV